MSGSPSDRIAKLAESARMNGKTARAAALARKALNVEDDTSDEGWHAAYRCLAMIAWSTNDFQECEKNFALALAHRRRQKTKSVRGLVLALDDLAIVQYYSGKGHSALELRREALACAEAGKLEDIHLLKRLRRRLGQSCQSHGFIEEADELYRQSRPQPEDSVEDQIGWHNAMALIAEQKGNIAEAAEWYDQLADILETVDAAEGLAAVLGNAIQTRLDLDNRCEAAAQMRRLRNVCRSDGKLASQLALLDARLACLVSRKRFSAALRAAERSERLLGNAYGQPIPVDRTALRAMLMRLDGRPREAIAMINERLPGEDNRSPDHLPLMIELANLQLGQGAGQAARALLFHAMEFDIGTTHMERKWWLFSLLADVADLEGRARAAILLGKFALVQLHIGARGLDGSELAGWLGPRMDAYTKILNRLTLAGRDPEAVRLQLRRTQELAFDLASRRSSSGAMVSEIPFRAGEARLWQAYLDLAEAARPEAQPAATDSAARARALLAEIFDERFDAAPVAAVAALEPKEKSAPCLAYLPCGDRLRGVLTGPDGEAGFAIGRPAAEIAGLIRGLRQALQIGNEDWLAASRALYESLIAPIGAQLASLRRLEIVASGMIGYVPFAALTDGDQFLVEKTAPCFRTGQAATSARSFAGTWLTAAFATAAGNDIPETLAEAQLVALKSGQSAWLEEDFTPERLRASVEGGCNLLHIATHFDYLPGRAHQSRLLFGNDAWLSLADMAGESFDLSGVELLVLSGCETGISDSLDLGLEGLAGLLQAKGARQVVATLWRIADRDARQLMAGFYDSLLSGRQSDPVLALADAQRAAIAEIRAEKPTGPGRGGIGARPARRTPSAWAGFTTFVR